MTRPKFPGFGGADDAAGEQQIARALVADLAREKNGNDGGEEADFDFGVAEFRFGNGEGEIAKSGDATAAGVERAPLTAAMSRRGEGPDAAENIWPCGASLP